MNTTEYIKLAERTDAEDYTRPNMRFSTPEVLPLTHYVLGIGTEAGEIQDIIKKHVMYGKEIDWEHLKEEIGDLLWYTARILNLIDSSFEEVMQKNIDKLSKRFPDKFTEEDAINNR